MVTDEQVRRWSERFSDIDTAEHDQLRTEIGEELDAIIADSRRRTEQEQNVEHWRHVLRRPDPIEMKTAPSSLDSPRRAAIRAEVERDVAAWEREIAAGRQRRVV